MKLHLLPVLAQAVEGVKQLATVSNFSMGILCALELQITKLQWEVREIKKFVFGPPSQSPRKRKK